MSAKKLFGLASLVTLGGIATLIYGALVESKNLTIERRVLKLPNWPERLNGYTIAVLADLHLRDIYAFELALRAVDAAIKERPDMIVIPGDIVSYWKPGMVNHMHLLFAALAESGIPVIVSLGNRDYVKGSPFPIIDACERYGFQLLRNSAWSNGVIRWVGLDSAKVHRHRVQRAFDEASLLAEDQPIVVLWHEPDMVDELPEGAALMISGHSHGGQFRFPGGFTPMHTRLGERFVRGFYPLASTPIYVSRGIGTTGPPSRLNCPPEVSILQLTAKP